MPENDARSVTQREKIERVKREWGPETERERGWGGGGSGEEDERGRARDRYVVQSSTKRRHRLDEDKEGTDREQWVGVTSEW